MLKLFKNKTYCFSPPVMLATLIIEYSFAIYTLWRYKMTTTARLAVLMLLGLGTFQLAEYMSCGGLGLDNIGWVRFGYIAITLLPALGIHMLITLAGRKMPYLIGTVYISCVAFVIFYLIGENAVSLQACHANYAVFSSNQSISRLFAAYYYGWLLIGTFLAWHWGEQKPKKRKVLWTMALGYLVFILPTTYFNIVDPNTVKGIPSIMCGFAVIFAFVLTWRVVPMACKDNPKFKKLIAKIKKK